MMPNVIKDTVCKCGKKKRAHARMCRKCWFESIKAQPSYCACGREKDKKSLRCYACKINEEKNIEDPQYWYHHDYCKCGRVKKKEVGKCRDCFYKEKRKKNLVCNRCGVKLTKRNRFSWALKTGERMCKNCTREYRRKANLGRNEKNRIKRHELKVEVITAYGGKCKCCGIDDIAFLSIDHIDGGGRIHRETLPGRNFYIWLKRNDYPNGFQVLCYNCNTAKSQNIGGCPHEIARQRAALAAQQ